MGCLQLQSAQDVLSWLVQRGARALTTDSRCVVANSAFIAWPGVLRDSRQFVNTALEAGACACVVEAQGAESFDWRDDRIVCVQNLKRLTGELASHFYGQPSGRMKTVAITGTNGKTSTSWWTAQALTRLGRHCGVVGTLGIGEAVSGSLTEGLATGALFGTGLTTPDPVTLQSSLRRFVDSGVVACAIEASSIGLNEQRLNGTALDVAVFTNFTQDHLNYHGTMESYWQAKAQLFDWPGLKAAVIHVDDPKGAELARQWNEVSGDNAGRALWTTSVQRSGSRTHARLTARQIRTTAQGLAFIVQEDSQECQVQTRLIGDFNVANLLGVIGILRALGESLPRAASVCSDLDPVPGRMQRVLDEQPSTHLLQAPEVVVDFAHTPDALEKALQSLQPLTQARGGQLWCVFGCGGNRDAGKRPQMGAIAQRLAQQVVLTSDNPRMENLATILAQIEAGMGREPQYHVIEDRRAAIGFAVRHAKPQDVILIAGKGHEDYQEIQSSKQPFSDVIEAQAALQAWAPHRTGARR
jgi:UDP-N-acetylmuramyl-tripeptide synthetase